MSGIKNNLALTTMNVEGSLIESMKVQCLSVRGVNSDINISLPATFSIESIPANKSHIPTPEIATSWPDLESIADQLIPLADCEIGLLIGYNCSRAMMPREIIPPPAGEGPYGQRTDLGWSIVGIVDSDF